MANRQDQYLARLCLELGLAVNDYNRQGTHEFDEIVKLTLAYLAKIQENVKSGNIPEDEIIEYFAMVGQTWAGIIPRIENEYESVPANIPKMSASSLPLPPTTLPIPYLSTSVTEKPPPSPSPPSPARVPQSGVKPSPSSQSVVNPVTKPSTLPATLPSTLPASQSPVKTPSKPLVAAKTS